MIDPAPGGSDATSDLLLEIVETLESSGIAHDEYRVNDFIDIEALERLLDSAKDDIEVRCTIARTRLAVTADGVRILERLER